MKRDSSVSRVTSAACVAVLALVAVALIAGCSLQPAYERPPLPVTATYPDGEAYKSTNGTAGTLAAADIGWRDFLTDPRLQRLVEIGLSNNRDLRVAALSVLQAQAQYRIERAPLYPSVDGFADGSTDHTPGSLATIGNSARRTHDYSVGLSAAWELDFFGRLRSLSDQALQQYFATAQARKATEILLVSEIADQYMALLTDDELIAVTQHTLETAQKSYDLTLLQFKTGIGTELAVRESETVVEQVKANHSAQIRQRAQDENALVLLIGQPLPAELPPAVSLNSQQILADIPAGLPSDLLMRRPDVMQAEATLRAANANIGAARAAFFPTVSLTGDLGSASSQLSELFSGGSKAWSFLPSVSVPIFNGGQLRASLDVAVLQKDINVAQYEKTIQSAFTEVADGLAARGTYDDQVASLQRLTDAQQSRLDLSLMRFRTGIDPYLTVLTAQTDLYSAQQSLLTTQLARLANLVDLYRSLGGGWIEHTGDVPRPAEEVGSR